MSRKFNKTNQRGRGAPQKREEERKAFDGLTFEQQKQLHEIAAVRGVSVAQVKRDAVQWYLDAVDQGKIAYEANTKLEQAETEEFVKHNRN